MVKNLTLGINKNTVALWRNRFRWERLAGNNEALVFWGYAAVACIIDNTNLARLRGTGKQAVIAPEMKAFGAQYGFEFVCHEKGCANL